MVTASGHDGVVVTSVYTDGACLGNPGPGGWAWAVPGGAFASGFAAHTTNQRMEVSAAFEAVKTLSGQVTVISDSTYVVNCFKNRWWEGWLARGWKNSAKQPVANRDLWEPFIELVRSRGDEISFQWVKGHSGDAMNDLVDVLAVEAANKQMARSGERPPSQAEVAALPADAIDKTATAKPASKGSSGAKAPAGHLLVVTGARPPELGGYDDNPVADGIRAKLKEIITAKAQLFPDLVVMSGLGLGAEQLGAEAALEANVPVVAVLAFEEQDDVWPALSKRRYQDILSKARERLVLESKRPTSKQAAGMALGKRDNWLARHANEAVVVWDGADARVDRQIRSLQDHLGDSEVWVVPTS